MPRRCRLRAVLLAIVLTALALAVGPARAGSCRPWSIEGFYLRMTAEEARALIARGGGGEETDSDGTLTFVLSADEGREVSGGLRLVDGLVASGWLHLKAHGGPGGTGAKGLAETLGRRFGEPLRESLKPLDTEKSLVALEWTDSDCGLSLLARYHTGNRLTPDERDRLYIELRPFSAHEQEKAAQARDGAARADLLAEGLPCSEPVEPRLLETEPLLVAGTRRSVEMTEDFRMHGQYVRLQVLYLVRADGSVGEVRLVRGPVEDYGMLEPLTRMLKAQQFVPGTCGGRPVSTWVPMIADYKVN